MQTTRNAARNSICPRGWRLPTVPSVSVNSDFTILNNVYNDGSKINGFNLMDSPIYLIRSGNINDNGAVNDAGSNGLYWSSAAYSSVYAYGLYLSSGSVNPTFINDGGLYVYRKNGRSVRCVSDY